MNKTIGQDSYERVGPKVKEVIANLYGEGVSVKNINNNDWWANKLFQDKYKGMEGRFPERLEEKYQDQAVSTGISRREFLKTLSAGATAVGLPSSIFKNQ